MLGTKINKPLEDTKLYAECAQWCNNNMCKLVEHDDYYEVVDNQPTEEELKAMQKARLTRELTEVTNEIAQLQGASMSAYSVDNYTEYDVMVNGELKTMKEDEFNEYADTLTDKRADIISKLKGL